MLHFSVTEEILLGPTVAHGDLTVISVMPELLGFRVIAGCPVVPTDMARRFGP